MTTTCPACARTHSTAQLTTPTRLRAALAIVKDWRVWGSAILLCLLIGAAGGALGLELNPGAMMGAPIGLYAVLRMTRMRACPSCDTVSVPK